MSRGFAWLLALMPSAAFAAEGPPLVWSSDGRWLAYTTAAPAHRVLRPRGWIFDTRPMLHEPGTEPARREMIFRIYATSVAGEGTTLLEESRGPLTAPSWSPDGRSLAFGRVVTEGPGSSRFEVVIQDGPRQQRVLTSRPLTDQDVATGTFASTMPAWSSDSRYLAVCGPPAALGLSVVRADNGRVLKTIEDAASPSWSPDSTKLAYIANRGTSVSLYVLGESFGASRLVADLGQAFQSPNWSRDGKSVLLASHKARSQPRWGVVSRNKTADLVRVDVGSGAEENLVTMSSVGVERQKDFRSISFTLDRDGEDLFFAADVEGQRTEVFWYLPRKHEILKRTHPLDFSVRVGALSLSPVRKTLALRLGPPGPAAPVALWEVAEDGFNPLVPDDSARVAWLSLLIDSARDLLKTTLPPPDGQAPARASILPARGEIPANHLAFYGLKRIGRIGRPLCDLPSSAPADPELAAFLAEARLFFDALAGNDAAALVTLDALEPSMDSPDERTRLLCLRTQLVIGLGKLDQAKDMVEFLKAAGGRRRSRYEPTPAGVSLTEEPSDVERWSDYLAKSAERAEKLRATEAARRETALGHTNPDNPNPPPFDPSVFAPAQRRLPIGGMMDIPGNVQEIERRLGGQPVPPIMPRYQRPAPK